MNTCKCCGRGPWYHVYVQNSTLAVLADPGGEGMACIMALGLSILLLRLQSVSGVAVQVPGPL